MTELQRYGKWEVVRSISRGGQGQVYLVRDAAANSNTTDRRKTLRHAIATLVGVNVESQYEDAHSRFADEIRRITSESQTPHGALKKLLPIEEGAAEHEAAAFERMRLELSTLQSVDHPALVKVLDSNLDEKWFVMEFLERGTLSSRLDKYKGNVLDALRDLRPIVDAVSALHTSNVVHRDIKPDNIFVASDDHLVLGDCGLAFKLENEDRLTVTFENVGTRDFQPPWSHSMRLADVRPTFDVFSLGKVLWAMVSGRPRFPFWYSYRPENDLREMFQDEPAVQFVHDIVNKSVVESEDQATILDATELLAEVDSAISAVSQGCQLPSRSHGMRCRFCGIGRYQPANRHPLTGISDTVYERIYFLCGHCGHIESFAWPRDEPPPAWADGT